MTGSKDRLVREFHCGQIHAAVFQRQRIGEGRAWAEYSVRIVRRFKNQRSGGVSTSTFFRLDDLPRLAAVASRAFQYISVREFADGREHPTDAPGVAVDGAVTSTEPSGPKDREG